ncbi:MAG: hypothetical protein WC636_01250 [Candidatus Margulisiibacteriota bacterium]
MANEMAVRVREYPGPRARAVWRDAGGEKCRGQRVSGERRRTLLDASGARITLREDDLDFFGMGNYRRLPVPVARCIGLVRSEEGTPGKENVVRLLGADEIVFDAFGYENGLRWVPVPGKHMREEAPPEIDILQNGISFKLASALACIWNDGAEVSLDHEGNFLDSYRDYRVVVNLTPRQIRDMIQLINRLARCWGYRVFLPTVSQVNDALMLRSTALHQGHLARGTDALTLYWPELTRTPGKNPGEQMVVHAQRTFSSSPGIRSPQYEVREIGSAVPNQSLTGITFRLVRQHVEPTE